MDNKTIRKWPRTLGALLFSFGILLGILLSTAITWASFEAVFYGFARLSTDQLGTLSCPLLMTTSDTRTVSAEFTNPGNKPTQILVRADISTPALVRKEQELLAFAPGETKKLAWTVNADNVDLRYFIFVKAYQYPSAAGGTREATCGIFVLPLSFASGTQVFIATLTVSLLSILTGLFFWERNTSRIVKREIEISRAMKVLAVIVLVGLLLSFQGNWVGGVATLAVSILLMGAILFFTQNR